MAWYDGPSFGGITPATQYALRPGANPKGNFVYPTGGYYLENGLALQAAPYVNTGSPTDWPLPDLELTTRPKQAEIVQYADYSQRAQGPYSFTWGFRLMKPWVFGIYLWYLGLETVGYGGSGDNFFYEYNPPIWTSGLYTILTLDTWSRYGDANNYRCFQGYCLRPVPGQHYKMGQGGSYENVLFRFVNCVEIFV